MTMSYTSTTESKRFQRYVSLNYSGFGYSASGNAEEKKESRKFAESMTIRTHIKITGLGLGEKETVLADFDSALNELDKLASKGKKKIYAVVQDIWTFTAVKELFAWNARPEASLKNAIRSTVISELTKSFEMVQYVRRSVEDQRSKAAEELREEADKALKDMAIKIPELLNKPLNDLEMSVEGEPNLSYFMRIGRDLDYKLSALAVNVKSLVWMDSEAINASVDLVSAGPWTSTGESAAKKVYVCKVVANTKYSSNRTVVGSAIQGDSDGFKAFKAFLPTLPFPGSQQVSDEDSIGNEKCDLFVLAKGPMDPKWTKNPDSGDLFVAGNLGRPTYWSVFVVRKEFEEGYRVGWARSFKYQGGRLHEAVFPRSENRREITRITKKEDIDWEYLLDH
ncbi:hypothetical protein NDN08_007575 [Rhodosorus marinus]|uniref:Uncharacterized protein n=1 Tax=Rhodosorus marinus TaxID=101924 RepID=A0AAV8UZH1_9RHOD|nr:hypothetical protein NDN08_007575 [Rhodosorus marinus]